MRTAAVALLVVGLAACAARPSGSGPPPDRSRIMGEEIRASNAANALLLVQQLRPLWLSQRGVNSLRTDAPVILYVNEARVGTAEQLAEYSLETIGELHHLDAGEATRRFGIGHGSGAIILLMRLGADVRVPGVAESVTGFSSGVHRARES